MSAPHAVPEQRGCESAAVLCWQPIALSSVHSIGVAKTESWLALRLSGCGVLASACVQWWCVRGVFPLGRWKPLVSARESLAKKAHTSLTDGQLTEVGEDVRV